MIALFSPEMEEELSMACAFHPVTGANIYTTYRCYGVDASSLVWLQRTRAGITSAISSNNGWLEISPSEHADVEELREFIHAMGGYQYLQAPYDLCRELRVKGLCQQYVVMTYRGKSFPDRMDEVTGEPFLSDIHPILLAGEPLFSRFAPWDSWYTHTSHLLRHRLGYAAAVYREAEAVATGGVYQSSPRYALVGSLATLETHRGKGYATLLIKYLVNRILEEQKIPALYCKEKLTNFYARLGFGVHSTMGRIQLL